MTAPMGKPNRLKDTLGVLLLLTVGFLYVTGVTEERGAGADMEPEMGVVEVSSPVGPEKPSTALPGRRT